MKKKSIAILIIVALLIVVIPVPTLNAEKLIDKKVKINAVFSDDRLLITKWNELSTLEVSTPKVEGYQYEVHESENYTEIDIILSKPPKENVFHYPVTTKNVEFYYQPPYTEFTPEKDWGFVNETHVYDERGNLIHYRPENVVGSYAVYGPYKYNQYGTGKIAHIYRPKVIDALGSWIWGELNYADGSLTVTVDRKWLDKAKYPVRIDPNFGYEGEGESQYHNSPNDMLGSLFTSPAGSNKISSLTAYLNNSVAGSVNFKGTVVLHSTLNIVSDGVSSPQSIAADTTAWKTATFGTEPVTASSTEYVLMMIADDWLWLAYDSGSADQGHLDITNSYNVPENPTSAGHDNNKYSIYVTYHSTLTINSAVISDMDDTDNCYAMKKYYTFVTNISDSSGADKISSISVRGSQEASVRWQVNATDLDGTPSYSLVTGANVTDLDTGSCSFTEDGVNGSLKLKIRFEWDYTEESNCELEVWAEDTDGYIVGWTTVNSNYTDVITRLTTYQLGTNNSAPAVSSPIMISGYVRYSLVPGGVNSSTSYPPDAQFTAVRIYDDESSLQGTDSSILDGYFSVNITSSGIIETVYYYAYLDLLANYTDGNAPDEDIVYVTTTASFYVVDQIKQAFDLYGVAWSTIPNMLTSIATYWTDAASSVLSFFVNIITFVNLCAGSVIYWLNLFVSFFVQLFTICGNIIQGTATVSTGLGNMWELIGFATWAALVPIVIFVFWYGGIDERSSKAGKGEIEVMVGDLQIVSYLVGEMFNWSYLVFNFVVNMLISLASLLVG